VTTARLGGPFACAVACRIALPIVTERLRLRPYVIDDVPAIHAVLYGDPEAMRLIDGAVDLDETRRRIELYIANQRSAGYSFWAVVERATGALAGGAGLIPFGGEGPDVELGYAFGRAFWGRGYATEAGRAVLAEALGPLGLTRLRGHQARQPRLAARAGQARVHPRRPPRGLGRQAAVLRLRVDRFADRTHRSSGARPLPSPAMVFYAFP
jgi:[ribosomal protein S5]-alanine N-acetyltransferase